MQPDKLEREQAIKITVKGVISPRDEGIRTLLQEYKVYKKVLISRISESIKTVIKDKNIRVYSLQKYLLQKKIIEYLKNLPYHPMPYGNQSYWIEERDGKFLIHIKTKNGESVCYLQVPNKYRTLMKKASGKVCPHMNEGKCEFTICPFKTSKMCNKINPYRGEMKLIEDKKYGWINCHITLRLPKPEPYEPKGWIGVDVGWNYLAVSAYVSNEGKISHVTFHGKEWKTRIIQLKYLLKMFQRTGKSTKVWRHRLRNVTNYTVGVIAKEIVRKAKKLKAGVAVEKLTFQAHTKRWLIPRYKLRCAIKNLCERKGIPFVEVSAKNTSIKCNKCGYIDEKNRNGKIFKCLKCKYTCNADFNAAVNIAKKAIEKYKKEKLKTAGKTAIPVSYTDAGKDPHAKMTHPQKDVDGVAGRGMLRAPKAPMTNDQPIDDPYKREGNPSIIEDHTQRKAIKTTKQQKLTKYLHLQKQQKITKNRSRKTIE